MLPIEMSDSLIGSMKADDANTYNSEVDIFLNKNISITFYHTIL